ncbi:MAG: hypothetical protein ACLFUU_09440 [Desulfobacteraceae bacterium]
MLIDWFTIIAQIINFLVLIALLKHFLYGRVINAMNQREERIAARLAEANQKKHQAEEQEQYYRHQNQQLENQKKAILDQAQKQAQIQRKQLMEKARQEVDDVKARWYDAIEREKNNFLQELRQRAGRQIYAVARQALKDLAHAELEDQLISVLIQRLQTLDAEERQLIAESIQKGNKALVINTSFEITEERRRQLNQTLQDFLNNGFRIHYHTDPEVILGIELKTPTHKIAWTLENYLDTLEAELQEALEEKGRSQTKAQLPAS